MGAAKKLKELFFGAPKKVNPMGQSVEKVTEIKPQARNNSAKYDKQEVEILKHKISRRFKEDPDAAKKAALIIEKMMNQSSNTK